MESFIKKSGSRNDFIHIFYVSYETRLLSFEEKIDIFSNKLFQT